MFHPQLPYPTVPANLPACEMPFTRVDLGPFPTPHLNISSTARTTSTHHHKSRSLVSHPSMACSFLHRYAPLSQPHALVPQPSSMTPSPQPLRLTGQRKKKTHRNPQPKHRHIRTWARFTSFHDFSFFLPCQLAFSLLSCPISHR
jgi:hypothetical protein